MRACLPTRRPGISLASCRGACAQHNVCGRSIYAQGTVDAVAFIAARARERSAKSLYNMVDVLSAGMA